MNNFPSDTARGNREVCPRLDASCSQDQLTGRPVMTWPAEAEAPPPAASWAGVVMTRLYRAVAARGTP
ncbi:hypothetical protein [Roseococcus pinisoli]|uniref:Uncharacterized protein n=1 Tax=Roseococcus pinisoli TaxID=2835040 RepID=A0ABS5Q8H2_9PROT|nr:hypothetical protein [Roseococcus pinisoli]MBS7809991.1 hypothetical protein [Roseococcus pinisoli]